MRTKSVSAEMVCSAAESMVGETVVGVEAVEVGAVEVGPVTDGRVVWDDPVGAVVPGIVVVSNIRVVTDAWGSVTIITVLEVFPMIGLARMTAGSLGRIAIHPATRNSSSTAMTMSGRGIALQRDLGTNRAVLRAIESVLGPTSLVVSKELFDLCF